jgi:hypothetical protein
MCYSIDPAVVVSHQKDRKEPLNVRLKSFNNNQLTQVDKINMKAALQAARSEDDYMERNLKVGKLVLRKFEGRPSKLHPRWDGPFIIHGAYPNGSFRLQSPNGHVHAITTNNNRLKRFYGTTEALHFNRNVSKSLGTCANNNKQA